MSEDALRALRVEMCEELIRRILPFWMTKAASDSRTAGALTRRLRRFGPIAVKPSIAS